ncbi:MAG: xanthine dehydrogenase family protein molybdopterin-binding subunit [Acidimicrobiia bacterium]
MTTLESYKWIGTRPVRPDGLEKVTGKARFGADLHLPGMLVGIVLRSPHAHARIRSVDIDAAISIPGVKAVVTAADLPEISSEEAQAGESAVDFRDLSRNVLARDKVLYVGHPVAAVAATTRKAAEAAAAAIKVEYEPLPHVLTVDEALAPDAPILHEDLRTKGGSGSDVGPTNVAKRVIFERGEVEEAFARADLVIEREFLTRPVHQGYIEPHAVVADTGDDGRSTVWCSSQGHFLVRTLTAKVLGWDPSRLRVVPAEIGGGFGGKTTIYLEPLAVLLSAKAGRPVKLVMGREEVFIATGPGPGGRVRIKLGATSDGKLVAGEAWMAFDAGAFPGSPVGAACQTVFAPYDIGDVRIEGLDVVLNIPKVAAYRAPGAPLAAFGTESVLDEIADTLGLDPIELRMGNAVEEGIESTYGPAFRRIGFRETLEAIRQHPHYSLPLGPNQGRGVASGFWFNAGLDSSATVSVHEDGTVSVLTGSPDIGGSRASMALMAAEALGIDVARVRPSIVDTDTIGYTDVTGGSRVTFATGMAVVEACGDIIAELNRRAAVTWGMGADEVEWVDGQAQAKDGSQPPLTLADIAATASKTGGPIATTKSLTARGVGVAFSTQVCDVEVDPDTGAVKVLRYTTAQDAGRAIHPSYVEGQMQGGVVQGIGWALNEEYVFDSDGRMENPSFLDYRMPVASDLPMIDTVIVEVPNPGHPFGVRGVGEVGIVPPLAAIANAIEAATGVRIRELPMSPPRVLGALLAERSQGARPPVG